MAAAKPIFAPVPLRCLVDGRLDDRHKLVLMVVAAHDRLGRNGLGCTASVSRIAELAGVDYTVCSAALNHLMRCGYLEGARQQDDGRARIWRVVYTDDDAKVLPNPRRGRLPPRKPSPADSLPGDHSDRRDSLPEAATKPSALNGSPDPIYSLKGKRDPEGEENPPRASRGRDGERSSHLPTRLHQIEKRLLETGYKPPRNHPTLDQLNEWSEELSRISDDHGAAGGDPIGGHAHRLFERVEQLIAEKEAE
ncbi:MAG: hypothetical protein KIS96_01165 [Bauldia sp.]|nr:hypothetical protein [Bauldia sp.]